MRIRTIAVMLILGMAAWLPVTAQQTATPPTNAPQMQDKSACACCEHMKDQAKGSSKSMKCCKGKDSCCGKKESKDGQTAMNCCAGNNNTQCAKDGNDCCGKDAKQGCCHHDTASNAKNVKQCCGGHSCCGQNSSQS